MSWAYVGFDFGLCRNHVVGGNDLSTSNLERALYNIDLYCSISFLGSGRFQKNATGLTNDQKDLLHMSAASASTSFHCQDDGDQVCDRMNLSGSASLMN